MITVAVDTQSGEPPPCPEDIVVQLASTILSDNGLDTGKVQVVFSDDEHLRRLKKQFLNQDQYTDVIAFHLNEPDEDLDYFEFDDEPYEGIADPLEAVNRLFFHFNDKLYFWFLKPAASGYKAIVPEPARVGVDNFFFNLAFFTFSGFFKCPFLVLDITGFFLSISNSIRPSG